VSLGWQIICTAVPAFLFGHGALAVSWLDKARKPLWVTGTVIGYGASALCLIVGSTVVIWS
jgi:hypothetical protein